MICDAPVGHRVLLCGSNYARTYVPALAAAGYPITGLLARDSDRSNRLAEHLGVTLFQSADEVDPDLADLACVALPRSADDTVLRLLELGLHLLIEHPRSPEFLERAGALAEAHQRVVHVNGHFVDLPAAQSWIDCCRRHGGWQQVRRLEILCQDRALYAAIDIAEQALAPPADSDFSPVPAEARAGEFTTLTTELWGRQLALTVHAPGAADGSASYLVDARLSAIFDHGIASMLSFAGPVIWNDNLHRLDDPARSAWRVLSDPTDLEQLQAARVDANRRAVDRLVDEIEGCGSPRLGEPQRTLRVARAWRDLGAVVAGE